ncbi:glycosyltransferase family 9 protein [Nocardiopsis lucentensis]|uniref:glycosyltransferase family 9 protein n=1 Tax=Nocardiopsis lucentensis TaxID=53441 RepID=UPI00034674DE|nr:glycosyltransferase family 9 protein [Nocardiopsis lucentensis]
MIADLSSVTRHWGSTVYTSEQVISVPLGYDREATPVGEPLPGHPDHHLRRALERCGQVVVAFDGKLGDSLLAFGTVTAVTDALALFGRSVPLTTLGRYGRLYPTRKATGSSAPSPRFIVGDEPGVALARPADNDHVLLCRPEQAHCRSDGRHVYPFLPARYYLALEERVGLRLPGGPPFLPSPQSDTAVSDGETLTIAAITATSWPGRKDYGAERFTTAARIIGQATGRRVRLHLVSGRDETAHRPWNSDPVRVEPVAGADLEALAALFARCDLVLGNDTGLTHLAAFVSSKAEVIGLYGRHSHSKWRTGLDHHHALATPFSERMHRWDMCPVRDGLDESDTERRTPLSAITPDTLADTAVLALDRGHA